MPDRLLTVAQVAELLGTKEDSGDRFPRRLIAERRIEFVRIRESVVHAYIAANTVRPLTSRRRLGVAA